MTKVLLAGESWITHTTHIKGMDIFNTCSYEEGSKWMVQALKDENIDIDFMPNHLATNEFPFTMEELNEYDAILLSDIGSNTLLLNDDVFLRGKACTNRLELLKEYVNQGGGLCMIGGYMSFTGIDAKARYGETPIADVLPVTMLKQDDRVEAGQGIVPVIVENTNPANEGIDGEWPIFLGYNKTIIKPEAELIATINGDPFIALGKYGEGSTAVFTSDCSPHWGTMDFVNWKHYGRLWANIVNLIAKKRS